MDRMLELDGDDKISAGQHVDLESQQTVLLIATINPPRNYTWGKIFAMFRACRIFSSIKANKDAKGKRRVSASIPALLAPTAHDPATEEKIVSFSSIIIILILFFFMLKAPGVAEFSCPLSDQGLLEAVHSEVHEDDGGSISSITTAASNAKLQHENISKIVRTRDLDSLHKFGGVQGIAEALNTDLDGGIPDDEQDLLCRCRATALSKPQSITEAPAPGFFGSLLGYCNSCTILLLSLAAVLSIGFGIKEEGLKTGWYEGVVIVIAIVILVAAPAIRGLWLKHSKKLFAKKKQRMENSRHMVVNVLRAKTQKQISIPEVVLGDIVCLERGSFVHVDGLFISGEFLVVHDGLEATVDEKAPFLFHGSKVTNGNGYMLVTSIGMDTELGELMSKAVHSPRRTSLPTQLDKLRMFQQIAGLLISILILIVLFLRFMLQGEDANSDLPNLKGETNASKEIMVIIEKIVMKQNGKISSITTSLTILLVGIVEEMPFLITFAIIHWREKMLSCYATAKELLACVSMGSATTICTDKASLYQPEVSMCFIGDHEVIGTDCISAVPISVREVLCNCISTPLLMPSSPCRQTEDPLLPWAASNLQIEIDVLRQSCNILKMDGLSSKEEGSGVLMEKNREDEREVCLYWKGPATTILPRCSSYYDSNNWEKKELNEHQRKVFEQHIEQMKSKNLKTLAFACRKTENATLEDNDLVFIGMVGLKNDYTCCEETREAVRELQNAGVEIILVSEADVFELKEIARVCGIPCSNGLVLDGEQFKSFSPAERIAKVDKIRVMGNCTHSVRLLLVQCLKEKGKVVVVVGTRTHESPALKESDVGISMGTWSSDIAKESSDIIVWKGGFRFLVTIIMCGRCTYYNIQKYIQLELVTTIAGTLISSITTISSGQTPITGIQLIWANSVVSLLGGPSLLMEPPRDELMHENPVKQTEPLITRAMWRNIVSQVLYQTAILVIFQFKGEAILGIFQFKGEAIFGINEQVKKSIIFNSFVLCQIFNQVNSRELEKKNVFGGLHRNVWFWVAVVSIVILQVEFIEVAHILVGNARLNMAQWAVCLFIGMLSWVVDSAAKFIWSSIKTQQCGSHIGCPIMTSSASTESVANLELPLINTNVNSTVAD
ncbi:hypothetical protein UlMin_017561 [Ulmus minor]